MSYQHLSLKQRFRLETYVELGRTQKEMAERLGVHPSSVSREFGRNGGSRNYEARKAHSHSRQRRKKAKHKTKKLFTHPQVHQTVEEKLILTWSPEQITSRVRREKQTMVSPETIYQFIATECPEWHKYLRQKKGKYRRKRGTRKREHEREEAKKKRIDTRPSVVETRLRLGDWEGDTIVGGERTTGILTHVERKSGYLLADLFKQKSAELIRAKTVQRFSGIPTEKKQTITYDNGTEFSDHERIKRYTGMEIYFAYPYHSWERGTNENTNGLLREFFPKQMKFGNLKQRDVDRAAWLINHRPRKRLGYLTPYEVFVEGKSVALQARM